MFDSQVCCMMLSLILQVDTAGWLQRTKQEKGPSSLSIVQSRKNLMRVHVVGLVLDVEQVCQYILFFFLHFL